MVVLEIVTAGGLLLWLYVFIIARWRRGFCFLMAYVPFAGAVTLALHLWPPSLLFKDIFLVVPTYVGFIGEWTTKRDLLRGFPRSIIFLMLCLVILTVIQTGNVGMQNLLMAFIGLKVWLFYIPLAFVAYAYVDT